MQRESDRFKVTFTIATFALFECTIVIVIFSEYKHQFVYPGDLI